MHSANDNFFKKMPETDCRYKNLPYICTRIQQKNGALVQLVRIRACHARGQGFESPTHRRRRNEMVTATVSFRFYIISNDLQYGEVVNPPTITRTSP